MTLGLTQPLTEMGIKNVTGGNGAISCQLHHDLISCLEKCGSLDDSDLGREPDNFNVKGSCEKAHTDQDLHVSGALAEIDIT
jgi:hypothetical protein